MTFEEFEEEIERIKAKSEMTNLRLDALEADYARLEKQVAYLANKIRWELQ